MKRAVSSPGVFGTEVRHEIPGPPEDQIVSDVFGLEKVWRFALSRTEPTLKVKNHHEIT